MPPETDGVLILTRRDIAGLMTPRDYLVAAETAFRAIAQGEASAPMPMHLHGHDGAFHVKGAVLNSERPVVAIKLNGNFPGNPKQFALPTIQGTIVLADALTGSPMAIMDSIEITRRRTAAASALAALHLARRDSSRIAICGCGDQAGAQLEALAAIFNIRDVAAWDLHPELARAYADRMREDVGLAVRPVSTLEAATADADIIVTCTTARSAFLDSSHVRAGGFVAAIGADNPEKSELTPELMARSKIVVDVLDQCLVMGDLHHAVSAGTVQPSDVWADLGSVVAGQKEGRRDRHEIFVFDSTGTAVQDVAAASQTYARAVERRVGIRMPLGGL